MKFFTFAFLIFFCFCSFAPVGELSNTTITATAIDIEDGDTYSVMVNGKEIKIRMDAIDAPEKGSPFTNVATDFLKDKISGKTLKIHLKNMDSYGRYIGRTFVGTEDISAEMIKAGVAWHYKKYNDESELASYEDQAKATKRGLWANPNALAPWEVRKMRRSGISTKELEKF